VSRNAHVEGKGFFFSFNDRFRPNSKFYVPHRRVTQVA
jgi:hypothetical protein